MKLSKISTGSEELDAWLDGGYDADIITTIYGTPGSGKTNLCLLAAVHQASQKRKVIFIDTEGGFSIDRLKQLSSIDAIKYILLLKATTFEEQREVFNKLLEEVNKDIGLIIVDSIAMLYRLELGAGSGAAELGAQQEHQKVLGINRALARQVRILNEIARKKLIPVIVTNQVYADLEDREKVHMSGGDILKYWSKCLIELKNLEEGKKKAILRKHRSLPEKDFVFTITQKGIEISREKKFKLF